MKNMATSLNLLAKHGLYICVAVSNLNSKRETTWVHSGVGPEAAKMQSGGAIGPWS